MTIYCNEPTQYRASDVIVNGIRLGEFTAPVEVEKIFLGDITIGWRSYASGTSFHPSVPYNYTCLTYTQNGGLGVVFGDTDFAIYSMTPSLTVTYPQVEGDRIFIQIGAGTGHAAGISYNTARPAKSFYSDLKRWKLRITELT